MTVKEFHGADIFEVEAEALSHGCNIHGATAGLAGAVFSRYPEMKKRYKSGCENSDFIPGSVYIYKNTESMGKPFWYIYNLFSQIDSGANADLELLRSSLLEMRDHMKLCSVKSVNIPQIGCGIGGLNWEDVRPLLEEIFGPEEDLVLQIILRK